VRCMLASTYCTTVERGAVRAGTPLHREAAKAKNTARKERWPLTITDLIALYARFAELALTDKCGAVSAPCERVRRVRRRVVGHPCLHRRASSDSKYTCYLLHSPSCQATAPLFPNRLCTGSARIFTRRPSPAGTLLATGKLSRSTRPVMSSELQPHLLLARAVYAATEADTSTEQYGYIPSISLGVIFITLFSLTALLHLGEIVYGRRYWFMICMVIGGIRECLKNL
jgi:hypothetical protein